MRSQIGVHLLQVVADQQHRQALPGDGLDELADPGLLLDAERRGRLVHQHDPRAPGHRPAHRDRLPLPPGQTADPAAHRRDPDPGPLQVFGRLGHHRLAVEPAQPAQWPGHDLLPAEEHIGPDAQVRRQRQVLVDGLDAGRASLDRGPEADLLPVQQDRPRCRLQRARDQVDQGRLTGPVVPDQPDDLPRVQLHVHIAQRVHAAVALGQIAHLDPGWLLGGGAAGRRAAAGRWFVWGHAAPTLGKPI